MALQSQLFAGDPKLEAAAVSDPAHIVQGARGEHVRKIQLALIRLDGAAIDADGIYGPRTAAAVAAFKQRRAILNFQGQIDDIVGKKTIAALDGEMAEKESQAPQVVPVLLLALGIKLPPVPETAGFRIRRVLLDKPGGSTNGVLRFRIYQIVDVEHRLTAFYFMGDDLRLFSLRAVFRSLTAVDKGAFSDFRTTAPIKVTAFQTRCTETITKTQPGPGRERANLSMPFFQPGGLNVSMEGLRDNNAGTFSVISPGTLLLIEPEPRHISK
jgi:hypothetical protein